MTAKALLQRVGRKLGLHIESLNGVPWGAYKYLDIQAISAGKLEVVFDIGANAGQTVREIRKVFPSATIYAFEPIPATFARLKAAVPDGVQCFQKAMGDSPSIAEMTIASDGQNTLLVGSRPGEDRVQVEVDTVDRFCAEHGIEAIDLLKIDTEGFEMSVLRGASSILHSGKVRFVLAEVDFLPRPAEPHGNFFEVAEYLSSLGYKLAATYAHGVDGQGWRWGDALFMRSTGAPIACSPYQLMRG